MLKLVNIKKDYPAGDGVVNALKGIDLDFDENGFISILGPSGCGKTTLLNIIGGLDRYTDGNLIINGVSTSQYKDRDWDSYRNHSIGFVFQSYNLIAHQTVLQNVEIALTLSGISKVKRKQRAKEVLKQVGLESQLNKRPNELSGGQMQRVAIARALVNNPKIILADEPTGALDTETSIQVMELLKEVSNDRLVIMVTHNPELADKYSTRIIRMLDGEITSDTITKDTPPITLTDEIPTKKKQKKPSMSLFTSFTLSLKNLFTKKGRTILTSFAGSIGIIGIALIFAVSQGTTNYINAVQEDTLSSYPITLEKKHVDITSLLQNFIDATQTHKDHPKDAIYQKSVVYDLINSLSNLNEEQNDLKAFKEYLEKRLRSTNEADKELQDALNGVHYSYDLDLLIYTKNVDGDIVHSDTRELLMEIISEYMGSNVANLYQEDANPMSSMMPSGPQNASLWQEILPDKNGALINPLLKNQYDVIYGDWPKSYNEIVLVLDENNELDDMTLYALGLKSKDEIDKLMRAALDKTGLKESDKTWSYKEICSREYKTILNCDCFVLDPETKTYNDLRETKAGLEYLYKDGINLKVTGIIRPNENSVSTMLTGSIGYTYKLTEYVIKRSSESDLVKSQLENPNTDLLSSLPFDLSDGNLTDSQKAAEFKKYIDGLTTEQKAEAYVKIISIPSDEELEKMIAAATANTTIEQTKATLIENLSSQMKMDTKDLQDYVNKLSDEEFNEMYEKILTEQISAQYASQTTAQVAHLTNEQKSAALDAQMAEFTDEQMRKFYDSVPEFSESSYEERLKEFGHIDLETPHNINLYSSTFAGKDVIEAAISHYNEGVDELKQINYTDYVGLLMSSVTTVIDAITYVLIAFVAISLIVSSIMIGVITLISVQERTKEIGILRSLGASKRDVSHLFNAETVIIGFTSGLLGVLITYLLCIPVNYIIQKLTEINNLSASLPLPIAICLILISVLLTLVSGVIPSRSAAKKDPVVALRTE